MILVNFKAYKEAFGTKGFEIAKACSDVAKKQKITIGVAVPFTELNKIAKLKIPLFAEHFDPGSLGAHTGYIPIKAIIENGAIGSLINHSEHPMSLERIKEAVEETKKNKIISVVCVPNQQILEKVVMFKPDIVALESPKLIGSRNAISKEMPQAIRKAAKTAREHSIAFLCGAGIHSKSDVKKAMEEGSDGILIASSVMKAKNPSNVLTKLCSGLKV
ncbi:MAG: triosephosphate isomerase [Candidatus Woesearchaeota archaeon]|nr:triosephosphate isomerase [Candidatus Woesearchaeota archaeon]